jgi:hypothetical protein
MSVMKNYCVLKFADLSYYKAVISELHIAKRTTLENSANNKQFKI